MADLHLYLNIAGTPIAKVLRVVWDTRDSESSPARSRTQDAGREGLQLVTF